MSDDAWVYCPFCDHRTPDMEAMCNHLLATHKGREGLPPQLFGLAKSGNSVSCWCADRFYYRDDTAFYHDSWVQHLVKEGGPTAHILKLIFEE